jgi:hypothetical protein
LRKIFGFKRGEVLGGWRRLHNEKLYDLHSTPHIQSNNQIKENEMGRACGTYDMIYLTAIG